MLFGRSFHAHAGCEPFQSPAFQKLHWNSAFYESPMQALSVSNSHDFSTIAVGGGARCEKKDVFFLSCSHIILASSARLIMSQRQSTSNRWCTKSSRCSSQPRTRRPSSACNTTPALSAYDRAELGQSVLALRTASDTNIESGFVAAMAAFDNRLIFLTDVCIRTRAWCA